ncbi:MAG: hypothetical protein KC417_07900 [Myxococcales bacterium]|nr:hypothetical protein [Myxococcales bacterium]
MRTVLTGMFIALAFAHWPALDALDPLVGTAAAVVVAVVIAGTVLGGLSPIVPVAGALAALSLTLAPTFGSAGALATVAIFAPRVLRARTRGGAAGMAVLASLAGGVAATVVTSYLGAATAIELTAVGVAAVVAMTPFLVPVDDSVGARIRAMLPEARPSFRRSLRRALVLRRRVERFPELRPSLTAQIERAWESLLEVAAAANDAPASQAEVLRSHAVEHLRALARIDRAVGASRALSVGLQHAGVRHAASVGDRLEAEVSALDEVLGWREVSEATERAPSPPSGSASPSDSARASSEPDRSSPRVRVPEAPIPNSQG